MRQDKYKSVDAYIADSVQEAQPILIKLRSIIKKSIPEVEEKVWYNVPFYFYHGELAGLSVSAKHVTFGFGANVLPDELRKKLESEGYKLGKGTMQIKFTQKVPIAAITAILQMKAKLNDHA